MSTVTKICWVAAALSATAAGAAMALLWTQAGQDQMRIWVRGAVLYDAAEVRFGLLDGFVMESPTSLRFGPDGRLYVASQFGRLAAVALERTAPGRYRATAVEEISLIAGIPNHNDRGEPQPEVKGRLIAGLAAAGSAAQPQLFVASSDPRLEHPDADSNSGAISRLELVGGQWRKTDLVRGLPRSHGDHATMGLHFEPSLNRLYVSQGSNTNAGAPSAFFHHLPEYALSGAILSVDLNAIGAAVYDLPTLGGNPTAPFGGRKGLHQALLPESGPVRLFASGIRNAYRIVERKGKLFTIDNGPNPGYGGAPTIVEGVATQHSDGEGEHLPGTLLALEQGAYYGHPNPTRATRRNRFGGSSPIARERPEESFFLRPGQKPGELLQFQPSVNGLAVYSSARLGAEWNGAFVAVGLDRTLRLAALQPNGAVAVRNLVEKAGEMPLDVTTRADAETFPGTIWVADYGSGRVLVIEPAEAADWLRGFWSWPRRALVAFVRWSEAREPVPEL